MKQRIESGEANPIVGNASIADVVACIAHAVDVAGIDHVGIGADFDGIPSVPSGLEDISKMPALRMALHDCGYSDSDIRKIMGENFLRVIRVGHRRLLVNFDRSPAVRRQAQLLSCRL